MDWDQLNGSGCLVQVLVQFGFLIYIKLDIHQSKAYTAGFRQRSMVKPPRLIHLVPWFLLPPSNNYVPFHFCRGYS